ncbi:MAG: 8-oxo-dGTP diphosphatase [Thermotogae bacterium]|nr:8-oxo-dGTP diphosphatase [Thermotogota bacterium]
MRRFVIGYPVEDDKVLLIYKKRGLGRGLYNGVGGKIEEGETPEEALDREAREEIGIEVLERQWIAKLYFWDYYGTYMEVDAFLIKRWKGDFKESDEARPVWFSKDNLPYDRMWEDDRIWLWRALRGERLTGRFWFNDIYGKREDPRLLRCEVREGLPI